MSFFGAKVWSWEGLLIFQEMQRIQPIEKRVTLIQGSLTGKVQEARGALDLSQIVDYDVVWLAVL